MTYDEYIPMYIKVLEARRTREVVTAQEWNNNFNLLIQQGDHTAEYLFELNKYLFVDDNGALPELITRAAATQEQLDIHENRFDNPHNVTATQTTTEAIPAVAGGNVQDVLADLKKQIDTKADDADAESKYEKKTDAARHIVDADCDDNTGVFTFYRADGSTFAFPTNLSKVVNNWAFDPITQKMIITLEDGTTQEVDLSAFITAFEFLDSDTIKFDIVDKKVSASISTEYLTTITDQVDRATSAATTSVSSAANATNSANAAASSATLASTRAQEATTQASNATSYASMASSAKVNAQTAETNARAEAVTAKSYSEGGTGTRTGENTDNSKYYSELAKSYAQQAASGQINSDWNETNPNSKAYIMNKPTVEQTVKQSTNAVSSKAVDDALTSAKTTLNQSINTLAGRVTQTETDINDLTNVVRTNELAYLGWSVPYEMPIQNYVDSNRVFHQRVGRVEISNITWILRGDKANVFEGTLTNKATNSNTVANMYCSGYATDTESRVFNRTTNKTISAVADGKRIRVFDTSFSNVADFVNGLKGVYLYYELATEITFNADGKEKIVSLEKHFEVNNFTLPIVSKNLLNPTLATTTKNGVTCEALGNGTYRLNGNASADTNFLLQNIDLSSGTYKIVGCKNGSASTFCIRVGQGATWGTYVVAEYGSGETFTVSASGTYAINIRAFNGASLNNVIIKPMISTDLNVTYDDFVPYNTWLDSSAIVGKALGKNLIPFPYVDGMSKTHNGVTFTVNADGSVVANGTVAGTYSAFKVAQLNVGSGVYFLNGCANGGNNTTYRLQIYDGTNKIGYNDFGNGVVANLISGNDNAMYIRIENGVTVNNLVFKPMLVEGTVAPTEYEKWQGLTSADATKYTKYAKIETDKYGADFVPQYVEPVPNATIFTTSEKRALYKLGSEIVFGDDGFYVFAKDTPNADINLRIGGIH